MLQGMASAVSGNPHGAPAKLKGTVVLTIKRNFLDFPESIADNIQELLGHGVSFQLVSATVGDPSRGCRGIVGKATNLKDWAKTQKSVAAGEWMFNMAFEWEEEMGVPAAVVVKNHHHSEFFLKTVTIEGVPEKGKVHFVCNSWMYPTHKYKYDRIFFANDTYLPKQTPEPLRPYREEELYHLRGDEVSGQLQEHDRVYGYAYYNDLSNPDKGADHVRPILGGSKEYPYPRRGRTGRPPTRTDPNVESRLPLHATLNIYVPRDERFSQVKMSDFISYTLSSVVQTLLPALEAVFDKTPLEFDSFQDVLNLYEGGIRLPHDCPAFREVCDRIPFEMIKELVRTNSEHLLKLPLPQVIKADKTAWMTDEEFAREMLAGGNPVDIQRLKEFPPTSKLDPKVYGDHTSSITASHIEKNLDGLTVQEALAQNKLFILDHHDTLIPYLNRINSTSNKVYASRTLLFLRADCTLKPLAIEMSLPHPEGEQHGAVNKVFTPATHGVEHSIWQLAKAYVCVNDSGVHQLISHWLSTHSVIEPFVIATNRQLSVMHPVHKLLSPHYRDTMNMNAIARQVLLNSGGILEKTVFPDKYAMEMSSIIYKNWKLTNQALPQDLLNRGVAVEDLTSPNKLRLLIEDYPYAVDGLAVWSAVEAWVSDYCAIYYPNDSLIRSDPELQAWWKEVREVGHGDLKDEPWWPKMQTVADLAETCTIIIWTSSAYHAAVNFGQYPYGGYLPNRPSMSRRFMPEPGTEEYEEVRRDPERAFMKTITSQLQSILGMALIELLSRHSSDEVYLGQRDTPEWTSDERALMAFRRFGERLVGIEKRIVEMNRDEGLKNRTGPVQMPYMLLYPNTLDRSGVGGLNVKGIPNSVSI